MIGVFEADGALDEADKLFGGELDLRGGQGGGEQAEQEEPHTFRIRRKKNFRFLSCVLRLLR